MRVYYADGNIVMQFGTTLEEEIDSQKLKEDWEYIMSENWKSVVRPGSIITYQPAGSHSFYMTSK